MDAAVRRGKYNAQRTELDGQTFDSKLEAHVHGQLGVLRMAGLVRYWLRQVPLHLPGGITYRVDFQVFYADGKTRYLDAKGVETAMFKTKKRMVEALYPITVETVRRARGRLSGL